VSFGDLAAAFGVGAALGVFPGPVQVLILSEATRGGFRRGAQVVIGANGTFAVFLLLLAAGLSALEPGPTFLRVVRGAGGAFLVYLGVDGIRSALAAERGEVAEAPRSTMAPWLQGVLAVVLNPGGYIFLATTASAMLAGAAEDGGRAAAFLTAGAMLVGVSVVDWGTLALGTGGKRVLGERVLHRIALVLAVILVALGVAYLVQAIRG
jgi:threonine/homoserine/homoserine lactone efflux protein